ncbi:MAG: hypothetical protein J6C45_01360, partial [Alistipes sp.]|nr:hypothetical protein [Alistipes sp.]
TSYLLAGDKIGPSKLQKATKLGVKIISEQEFMAMIGNQGVAPSQSEIEKPSQNQTPIQGSLF